MTPEVVAGWRQRGATQGELGFPNGEPRRLADGSVCHPFEGGFLVMRPRQREATFEREIEELTDEERRMHAVRRRTASPLLGATVHALRRLRSGRPAASRLEEEIGEVDPVDGPVIDQLLAEWDALPAEERARLSPRGRANWPLDEPSVVPAYDAVTPVGRLTRLPRMSADVRSGLVGKLGHQVELAASVDDLETVVALLGAGLSMDDDLAERVDPDAMQNIGWAGIVDGQRPRIFALEPPKPQVGSTVNLVGERFAPVATDNTITLYSRAADGSLLAMQDAPSLVAASSTHLQFVLPPQCTPGAYAATVTRPNEVVPTAAPVVSQPHLFSVGKPAPTITSIEPANPEPDHVVTINGDGFLPSMALKVRPTGLQPALSTYAWTDSPFDDLTYVSPTQLSYRIPSLNAPGTYQFKVREMVSYTSSGEWSDWSGPLEVAPPRFRVIFEKFYCYRTTWEQTKDEIIFSWAIGCDEDVWAKTTTEYGSIVARSEPYGFTAAEGLVFPPPNLEGRVKRTLFLRTDVYENDNSSKGHALVKYLGKVAADVNNVYANPYTGAVEAGAPLADDLIDVWEHLFGGVDRIGSFEDFWQVHYLTHATSTLGGKYPLFYPNNVPPGYFYVYEQLAQYFIVGRVERVP